MQEVELWLRLMAVRQLNTRSAAQIFQSLRAARAVTSAQLAALALSTEQIAQFQRIDNRLVDETLRWLDATDHHVIACTDPAYPPLLHQISSPPRVLFVRGDPQVLTSPQIAIVGSRQHSMYGEQWGTYFAQELTLNGFTITSGLALGIDGVAHRAALEAEGKTVAVLGSGLLQVYPRRHCALADRIVAQGGAVISEFPLNATPRANHFPRRNRIISGLSLGVLIVEASKRSGSLVTARYALEQNRDVYAIPGPVGNPMSEGPHWLIQQGALLVAHPKDIVEQLGSDLMWLPPPVNETISAEEAEVELPFADVLANVGDEVTPIDVVAERAGQPVPEVIVKLLDLELAGWIEAVPGGYVRLRRAGHVRRTHVLI